MPILVPRSSLSPDCISCCRHFARLTLATPSVGGIQVRGKKKNAKAKTTLDVKLLKDLPGYGRRGSIVPVTIGRMRNIYFPQRIADYVSLAQAKDLRRNNVTVERDFNFGKETAEEKKLRLEGGADVKGSLEKVVGMPGRGTREGTVVKVEVELLSPAEAYAALSATIPPFMIFYRTPTTATTAPTSPTTSSSLFSTAKFPTSSTTATSPHLSKPSPLNQNIYGSVSTSDIATSIRTLLSSTPASSPIPSPLASNIVLADDDIRIVQPSTSAAAANPLASTEGPVEIELDRIKQLGTYDFDIRVRGHTENIRRQVRVLSQEEAPEGRLEGQSPLELRASSDEKVDEFNGGDDIENRVAELGAALSGAQGQETGEEKGKSIIRGGVADFGAPKGSESAPRAKNERI